MSHPHPQSATPAQQYQTNQAAEYPADYSAGYPANYPANYPAEAPHYNYYDNAYAPYQPSQLQSWFNFRDQTYLKGFVVGVGVALVVSNPSIQKAFVRGAVKLWSGIQGGVEEIKEHVKDIKAEVSSKE